MLAWEESWEIMGNAEGEEGLMQPFPTWGQMVAHWASGSALEEVFKLQLQS